MFKRSLNAARTCLPALLSISLVVALCPVQAFADEQPSSEEAVVEHAVQTSDPTFEKTEEGEVPVLEQSIEPLEKLDDAATRLIEDYFDARAKSVRSGTSSPATELESDEMTQGVADNEALRSKRLNTTADKADIKVVSAENSFQIQEAKRTDAGIEVAVYEWTTMVYDNLADGSGGRDTSAFGTRHIITITYELGDTPTIASDEYDDSSLSGIDTVGTAAETSEAVAQAQEEADKGLGEKAAEFVDGLFGVEQAYAATYNYPSGYSAAKASAYADKYWQNYNKNYSNYNSIGGDCANFVSQCIYAGGMKEYRGDTTATAWYYDSYNDRSSSWAYCPSQVSFFANHGKQVTVWSRGKGNGTGVFPGSPVWYKDGGGSVWQHATICVGYDSAGTPVVNSHNNDRYHVVYCYWYGDTDITTVQLTSGKDLYNYDSFDTAHMVLEAYGTGLVSATRPVWVVTGAGTVELASYKGAAANVTVPTTVTNPDTEDEFTVTGIADGALRGNTSVKTSYIPKSVTEIGASAYQGCSALTTATGFGGVKSIGAGAFLGCKQLRGIPECAKITSIGARAFKDCSSFIGITRKQLTSLTTMETNVFNGCSKMNTVVLSSPNLTCVPDYTFYKCTGLTTVNVFSRVSTKVGAYAYYGCKNLTVLDMVSGSNKTIGAYAFYGTSSMKRLYVRSVKLTSSSRIGKGAFSGVRAAAGVYVPSSKRSDYLKWFRAKGLETKTAVRAL